MLHTDTFDERVLFACDRVVKLAVDLDDGAAP